MKPNHNYVFRWLAVEQGYEVVAFGKDFVPARHRSEGPAIQIRRNRAAGEARNPTPLPPPNQNATTTAPL